MIKFLAYRVKTGKLTLEEVPEKYRKAVEKELNN